MDPTKGRRATNAEHSSAAGLAMQWRIIGLGTGTTLGTIASYPWKKIELVEISPAIVEAADQYFRSVNNGAIRIAAGRTSAQSLLRRLGEQLQQAAPLCAESTPIFIFSAPSP